MENKRNGAPSPVTVSTSTQTNHFSRLLIVDDDSVHLHTLSRILAAEGFDVTGCQLAVEALEHLRQAAFSVAIFDLRLPDLDGVKLVEEAQQICPDLRIIVHSGYGSFDAIKALLNLGTFAFTEKLGDPQELVRHVHRAVHDYLNQYARQLEATVTDRTLRLRESERWLELAETAGGIGTWDWDLRTYTARCSETCLRLFGYSSTQIDPTRVTFKQWIEMLHPEDRTRAVNEVQQAAASGASYQSEYRVIWPNGATHWLLHNGQVQLDESGKPVRMIGATFDITTRKQAEINLQNFFTLSVDMLCVAGLDGYFKRVSPAFTQTLGFSQQELLSKPFFDFIHPHDRAATVTALQALSQGQQVVDFENRYYCKDGAYVWLQWRASPSADGKTIYAIARDITERKRQALLMEQTQSAGHIGGWELDFTTQRLYWTDETYRIHETTPQEYSPTVESALAFYAPEHIPIITEAVRRGQEEGVPWELELELITAKQRRIWTHAIGKIVKENGKPVRAYGSFRDITERKRAQIALKQAYDELEKRVKERTAELQHSNLRLRQEIDERIKAEQALRTSEEQLELALHGADLALWDWNIPAGEVTVNERWAEIRGFSLNELRFKLEIWRSFIHPDDLAEVAAAMDAHIAGQTPSYEYRYRTRTNSAEWKWILSRGKVVERDAAGRPVRFIGTQLDITENKRLEQQLLQAQKLEAIGRLAGGVAHDFNNILTVIISYSELILKRADMDGRIRTRVEEIRKAAERAARLTHQLLAFSRRQTMSPVVLNLNAVIAEVEKMLHRLIGEDIELALHLDPALRPVKADPSQIEQVLMNLAVNSRDAMPAGGKLSISTRNVVLGFDYVQNHPEVQVGTYVMFAVKDTGHGMDANTQARIFEPFFTTKEPGKGTGLGLATVFGIVKQSHGHIEVESEPEKGTTFRIFLPQTDAVDDADARPRSVVPETALGGRETVLLVEDEEQIRSLAYTALQDAGYNVLVAANGPEALQQYKHHPLDIIVTDIIMPGMRGRQLVRHLMPHYPSLKVLYISGYTDDSLLHEDRMSQDEAFLAKPFTPTILIRKVREVLDQIQI